MLGGWGNLMHPGREVTDERIDRLTEGAALCRGLGRSYGDSALPPPGVVDIATTTKADRFLSFDDDTGELTVEAGARLHDIIWAFLPRGWFVPVTPGTAYVTVGGMVAADVHGKGHHRNGCFGVHVTQLLLRTADGRLVRCGPNKEAQLFDATVGGMGLTGHLHEVTFRMQRVPSPWIFQESERVENLSDFLGGLRAAAVAWPYTMGWIDCLSTGDSMGRGVLYRGRWATPEEAGRRKVPRPKARVSVPFMFPSWALNRLSIRAFNALIYRGHLPRTKRGVVHPTDFFHPLDKMLRWNRIYGKRGFTQHQCVLPRAAGSQGVHRFFARLTELGGASFLCVIKDCGPESRSLLSFPMEGISIALDMAVNDKTQGIVDALNREVIDLGGRIYLAKDAFTQRADFETMEPRLSRFSAVRRRYDPTLRIRSRQSSRLIDPPVEEASPHDRPARNLGVASAQEGVST